MSKVYFGKITGPFGIKGELKVLTSFKYLDKVLNINFPLYINDNLYHLTSYRKHQNFYLITLNNIDDLNKVNDLINKDIYIERNDLTLKEDEYLDEDLLESHVYDEDEDIGIITDILIGKNTTYVKVNNQFLIPLISVYIISFNKDKKILYTKNGKSLII